MRTYISISLLCLLMFFSREASAFYETRTVQIYPNDGVTASLYDEDAFTSWSEARAYTGELFWDVSRTSETITTRADRHSGYYRIYRGSMLFDTSSIPDGATIDAVSMNVYRYPYYDNDPVVFTEHTRTTVTNFVASDWQIQNYGAEFARGALLDAQYTKYAFNNAGVAYINTNGFTDIGVLISWDFDNIDKGSIMSGSAFYSGNAVGTSTDPYLEVTYTIEVDDEPKDVYEQIHELIEAIDAYEFPKAIENAYFANLKKVEGFLRSEKYVPAENQVRTFLHKLEQDMKKHKITKEAYNDLSSRADALLTAIEKVDDSGCKKKRNDDTKEKHK